MAKTRTRPAEPAEILAKAAERRKQHELRRAADPSSWGIEPRHGQLDPDDMAVVPGDRGPILIARRRDVFDTMLKSRSLTAGQHTAARRLIRDYAESQGVAGAPEAMPGAVNDNGAAELVTDRMINARDRLRLALHYVGPASAIVLQALVQPLVMNGVATDWREIARRHSGETEAHAQGGVLRHAVENLRLVYRLIDDGLLMSARAKAAERLREAG